MLFEITYIIAKLAFEGACIKKNQETMAKDLKT